MSKIRWRLAEYLEAHQLTAYAIAKQTGGTRMNTLYRIARRSEEPSRVDFTVLAAILDGLRKLTGEEVQITDILEYLPDD
jgi:Cro/C1-type HTH DNA-binding domain